MLEEAERQRDRQEWKESFQDDSIDLRGLPKPVVKKSRKILRQLEQGTEYYDLKGVRLECDRSTIRIPVTQGYRMLCDDIDGQLIPREVMSHQRYNKIVSNTKR